MSGKFHKTSGRAVRTIAKRSFAASRTQNLLISVAAVIVTILITAACSVFYHIQRYGAMQEIKARGTMTDALLSEPDEAQIALLEGSSLIEHPLYLSYQAGRLVGNEGQSGLNIYLYVEKNWDVWSRPLYTDIQGSYPKKENEIMMSSWLLKRMGIEPVIGSAVTLSVAWEDTGVAEEETFVLSGFYTDASYIDTASRQRVLISEAALMRHPVQADYAGFSFTGGQSYKNKELIREQLAITEGQNFKVQKAEELHLSSKNAGIMMAVILFFMLDGFLIIYNINTISVAREIRFYGLLKTIGTTPKQLKQIMYDRMRRILVMALPAGILLGCLITQWAVPRILSHILDGFTSAGLSYLIPSAAALFSGLMICTGFFVTARKVKAVSPIAAFTFTGSAGREALRKKSVRGGHAKLRQMGLRNVFRQPGKAGLVIGTFFLSSLTFLICMTVLRGMSLDEYIEYNTAHDISLYNSMSRASFSAQEEQSFTPELIAQLKSMEGVEKIGMTKVVPIYEQYSDEVYGDWLRIKREFEEANEMEPSDPEIWRENPKAAFWSLLIGVDSDVIEDYNRSAETPVDVEGFERGDFLLTTDMNGSGLRTGSVITFSVMDTDRQFALPIGGQIPFERDGMNSGAAPWLLISNKVIDGFRQDAIIYSVKLDCAPGYEESVLAQVAELTEDIPAIARTSKAELAESLEGTKRALSGLSAFLTVVLFTVGILNFINTMSVSVLGRQREFAVMEAVGAGRRQMRALIAWEGFWYFAATLGLSVTAGTVCDLLIFRLIRSAMGFGTFHFPMLPMTAYMLLSLLLCMAIPAVIYKKSGTVSIVERLREN